MKKVGFPDDDNDDDDDDDDGDDDCSDQQGKNQENDGLLTNSTKTIRKPWTVDDFHKKGSIFLSV